MERTNWENESKKKIILPENLSSFCQKLKEQKKTIVTFNGSFDIMHVGHLSHLFAASKMGDVLIVGLNSDRSIKEYKDPKRPIIPLQQRLQMMAAIGFVDYVSWFDEIDPRKFLCLIQPDIHANCSEYGENCIEAEVIQEIGAKLCLLPLIPNLSTTNIINKIKLCD